MNEVEKIREKLEIMESKGMKNWYFRGNDINTLLAEIDRLNAELKDLKAEQKKDVEEAIAIIHDQGAVNIILKEDNVILTAERDGFRNGQAQLQSICDGLMDTNAKYAAERIELKEENRRLKEELTALAQNTVPI